MMRSRTVIPALALALLCLSGLPEGAQAAQLIEKTAITSTTAGEEAERTIEYRDVKFRFLAQDAIVPAGETRRFQVRSAPFSRVSLLASGDGAADDGAIGIVTIFGPPLVPAGPPQPLARGEDGRLYGKSLQPVLGPIMVVLVHNDSSSDVMLTLSAYFAD